jgi:hypothetical protein
MNGIGVYLSDLRNGFFMTAAIHFTINGPRGYSTTVCRVFSVRLGNERSDTQWTRVFVAKQASRE